MREIKFREWETERKTMVIGEREDYDDSVGFRFAHEEGGERILMQSTGMKDKNGVEIYEGDIVQSTWYDVGNNPYKKIGEIIFVGAEYVIAYDSQFDVETGEITYDAHSLTYAEDVEVIGNIYENTELLEREAE